MPVSSVRRHRSGSVFSKPISSHLDRNLVARILFAAEALDRRTRAKGQHGGVLKLTGLAVLRALLLRFHNRKTGACYPSYAALAVETGLSQSTVGLKLAALAAHGFIEIIRRKVVTRFTSRVHHLAFDVAVQTSNSYVFPRLEADTDHRRGTGIDVIKREASSKVAPPMSVDEALNAMPDDLAEALRALGKLVDAADGLPPS